MQTSNFLRTFGEAFRQGCRNCIQSVQWSVISKKTLFRENSSFLHVFGLSVKKMRTVGEKVLQELQMRNMYLDACLRKTTLVVRKTLSSIFELSEKKVRELDQKFPAVFSKEILLFQPKILLENYFFVKIVFFFHFFSLLSYLFSVYLLKNCCRNLKSLIWKPNKKFCGGIFFLKLCSFVIFADIEFPPDFQRSFSTGLPELYPECSVERYQQKHTFRENSNCLHVFGLSVKKMRTVGEKASQELQMRNLCI